MSQRNPTYGKRGNYPKNIGFATQSTGAWNFLAGFSFMGLRVAPIRCRGQDTITAKQVVTQAYNGREQPLFYVTVYNLEQEKAVLFYMRRSGRINWRSLHGLGQEGATPLLKMRAAENIRGAR